MEDITRCLVCGCDCVAAIRVEIQLEHMRIVIEKNTTRTIPLKSEYRGYEIITYYGCECGHYYVEKKRFNKGNEFIERYEVTYDDKFNYGPLWRN